MTFCRNISIGVSGEDVLYIKRLLHGLGWYDAHITAVTKLRSGSDTLRAVRRFQRKNGLTENGVIDADTWAAIVRAAEAGSGAEQPETGDEQAQPNPGGGVYALRNIGADAMNAIASELDGADEPQRGIVLDALSFAFDPAVPRDYPVSLYIRGGNLYNKDLARNVITLARIASGAKSQPAFYDGGRREMMERAVRADPAITGADCSGGVVGLFRHAGVVSSGFDTTANGFYRSSRMRKIARDALLPADLVHRSGHIGLYAGGGYAVEWMGGAYGCQLTKLSSRRGYSFVTGKTANMGAWTGFLRPTYY